MPSPPGSCPSRQLTVRLPWHVWARLVALAAADPHGAKPGRVAATALARGVEVLERPLAHISEAPAREALAALVADFESLAGVVGMGAATPQARGCYHEALRLARKRALEALGGAEGSKGAGQAADAPTAPPRPSLPVYLTTPSTQPWGVEVGRAVVEGLAVAGPTAEDEAAAEAVNRGAWRASGGAVG